MYISESMSISYEIKNLGDSMVQQLCQQLSRQPGPSCETPRGQKDVGRSTPGMRRKLPNRENI